MHDPQPLTELQPASNPSWIRVTHSFEMEVVRVSVGATERMLRQLCVAVLPSVAWSVFGSPTAAAQSPSFAHAKRQVLDSPRVRQELEQYAQKHGKSMFA